MVDLENRFVVAVGIDEAWRILLDVRRIIPCMPGATLDEVTGDGFTGRVKVEAGPIMQTYRGTAKFVQKNDETHEAVVEASGTETRGTGTAQATVTTRLLPDGNTTQVRVLTNLAVTGKPAQFGRGVMADVSGKLIAQFANCLAEEIRGGHLHTTGAVPAAGTGAAPPAATSARGSAPVGPPLPRPGCPRKRRPHRLSRCRPPPSTPHRRPPRRPTSSSPPTTSRTAPRKPSTCWTPPPARSSSGCCPSPAASCSPCCWSGCCGVAPGTHHARIGSLGASAASLTVATT